MSVNSRQCVIAVMLYVLLANAVILHSVLSVQLCVSVIRTDCQALNMCLMHLCLPLSIWDMLAYRPGNFMSFVPGVLISS